jgi:transposase
MDERDALRAQAVLKRQTRLHSEVSYKRLERGRFIWPTTVGEAVTITPAQMGYLLEGIDWRAPQRTFKPQLAG